MVSGGLGAASQRRTLTVPEAAQLLGVSPRLLYEEVRRGNVPSIRVGHRVLISRAHLAAMLGETVGDTEEDGWSGRAQDRATGRGHGG